MKNIRNRDVEALLTPNASGSPAEAMPKRRARVKKPLEEDDWKAVYGTAKMI